MSRSSPGCRVFSPRVHVATLLCVALLVGCRGAAADVPATDIRRLPKERKEVLPDIIVQAADHGRVLGERTAPITMLIVSDYQCAECRTWFEQLLPAVRREFVETGKVRLTWVHYPLRAHPNAVRAASAAMCASAQGRFWEASARLFATQELWVSSPRANALLDSLAIVPGIEEYKLRNCTAIGRMLRQIRSDIDWTDTTRAGAPPRLVIGSRQLDGTTSLVTLRATLDSAIAGR